MQRRSAALQRQYPSTPARWGDGSRAYPAESVAAMEKYWSEELGQPEPAHPVRAREPAAPPLSRLSAEDVGALRATVSGTVSTSDVERLAYSFGRSYEEILRWDRGLDGPITDAIVVPHSADELQRTLAWGAARGIAIVPWGGGTSLVGGVEPRKGDHRAVVTVLMGYLNRPLGIDPATDTARFEVGIRGPDLEKFLTDRGLTLGHFPHSFEFSTLGGWIATGSSGQSLGAYGNVLDRVTGARWATPAGFVEWRRGGPDPGGLDPRLVLASEGTLGVLVEASVRFSSAPGHTEVRAALFPSWESALGVLRVLAQDDPRPAFARVSDPAESRFLLTLARSGRPIETLGGFDAIAIRRHIPDLSRASFGLVSFDGLTRRKAAQGLYVLDELLRQAGGLSLPGGTWPGLGDVWLRQRFRSPALRDGLVPDGWVFEGFEVEVPWDRVVEVAERVRARIVDGLRGLGVRSLVYVQANRPARGSVGLTFTIIYHEPATEPIASWSAARAAARDALRAAGLPLPRAGGLGAYDRASASELLSAEDLSHLLAYKRAVDPSGVLNPGKFLKEFPGS